MLNFICQSLRYHLVINSPAQVFAPSSCAVRPPTVVVRFCVNRSERIHKSAAHESIHPFAFFRQETRTVRVAFRVMNVNRFVANIVIARDD